MKRIVYALGTLGLGAFLYALLRNEGERVLAPVKERLGSGRSGGAGEGPPRRRTESAEAVGRPDAEPIREPVTASDAAGEVVPGEAESEAPKVAARPAEPVAQEEAAAEPDRCVAHTKSGARCARAPLPGSQYCWQHQPE